MHSVTALPRTSRVKQCDYVIATSLVSPISHADEKIGDVAIYVIYPDRYYIMSVCVTFTVGFSIT